MADARDAAVWTHHADEQWDENKEGHPFDPGNVLRLWLVNVVGSGKVLDFGCGGGLWRKMFIGFDYHGSDQNENMIRHAQMRFPEDKFMVNSWDNLSYEDGYFDAVFTSAVLQHNRHKDKEKAVAEIVRVLRPGGHYIATENTFRPDNFQHTFPQIAAWVEGLDDGYSFTPKGWETFLGDFGLRLVEYKEPSEYIFVKL